MTFKRTLDVFALGTYLTYSRFQVAKVLNSFEITAVYQNKQKNIL